MLCLICPFLVLPAAQLDVLSAALLASSLDAREEDSDEEKKSEAPDELSNCKLNHDSPVPLINESVEVTNSVKCLSSKSSRIRRLLGTG